MDRRSSNESFPGGSPLGGLGGLSFSGAGGVGGGPSSPFQSPFLQVDPSVMQQPPLISNEFIFPEGATKSSRGRFELAFGQIGFSVGMGAGIGGAMGTFKGLREVSKISEALSVKRTHLLNYITRNGAPMGNTFGVIALIYSAIGVGLSFIQDENDEINTAVAATTTGTLYGALSQSKAMEGLQGPALTRLRLKRAGFGFAGGLIASATLIYAMNQDKYGSK